MKDQYAWCNALAACYKVGYLTNMQLAHAPTCTAWIAFVKEVYSDSLVQFWHDNRFFQAFLKRKSFTVKYKYSKFFSQNLLIISGI